MTIAEIINILENKIKYLNSQKSAAHLSGDLDLVIKIDEEITEIDTAINKLKL